jgi:hypothetical protein
MERYRMPLLGPAGSQREAMEACAKDASVLLDALSCKSVLSEECRRELSTDRIDRCYFYLGQRANAKLGPVRMWVDGRELALQGDDEQRAVLQAVCELGNGFRARDLGELVPHVDAAEVAEILTSLTKIGFLDFVDTNLYP